MKLLFTLACAIVSLTAFSQDRLIQITNPNNTKTVILKEHKRIRLVTNNGKRISGKFTILNKESISINNKQIQLSDIKKIKRNPLGMSLPTSLLLGYSGVIAIGFGGIIALVVQEYQGLLLIPAGAAAVYGSIVFPNVLKGYKTSKNWQYKIIY